MNYGSANYYTNVPDYYNFPAYRAIGGSTGSNQTQNLGGMQGGMQGGPQGVTQGLSAYPPKTPAPTVPSGAPIQGVAGASTAPTPPGLMPLEQSYIENILRLNLGKVGTFYMTYENNTQWNAKVFRGKIEAAGRDHIIISDVKTGMRFLLLMVNLDYVTFDEELNYSSPYQIGTMR
jgi:spore germination protein Q